MINTSKYSQIVKSHLQNNSDFQTAISTINNLVPKSKIWLIGGQVFRPILKEIYDIPYTADTDFDFIIEKLPVVNEEDVPKDFILSKTGLGAPSLTKGNLQIDLIPLEDATKLSKDELTQLSPEESLERYFQRVPLNIQAIAYDVLNERVIGQDSLKGIQDKVIKPMSLGECLSFCKRRGISTRKFFDTKIKGDIFKREYPDFSSESKTKTEKYYSDNIEEYLSRENFDNFVLKYFSDEISYFLKGIKGHEIIDIGAGTGRDSNYFIQQGYNPFAIDISQGMVNYMKDQNINAERMDIENCDIEDDKFDGAYAFCSLLHIPKGRMFNSLARISEILKDNGKFFVCMIEGQGEKEYKNRHFTLYSKKELREELSRYFIVEKEKTVQVGTQTYIGFVCSNNTGEYKR
jgi:SAM-dependent methyltransferase